MVVFDGILKVYHQTELCSVREIKLFVLSCF